MTTVNARGPVSNDGEAAITATMPYIAAFTVKGNADMLFHRWSVEAVAEKAAAAKGSAAKKTDNTESYVWRDDVGEICLPGEYVRQAVVMAAKFRQDPRSPRKSAMDLYKAAIISLTPLASLGSKDWDYLDQRRVTVMRSGITRVRPAMRAGWEASFEFQVQLPEYVPADHLHDTLINAGRLIGVGDFRPTYGRFLVTSFKIT